MITKDEIQELLHSTETYRVERTVSTGDMDKFQEAICAFANDMPNSRKNGYKADLKIVPQKSSFHTTTTNVVDSVVDSVVDVARNVVKANRTQISDRQVSILELMILKPTISATELSQRFSITSRTIQRDIAKIKKLGLIEREGDDHGGKWIVIIKPKELTHEI